MRAHHARKGDGKKGDHSAQKGVSLLVLPRVTRCLSDHPFLSSGKTGV